MPVDRALSRAATDSHTRNVRLAIIESLDDALSALTLTPRVALDQPVLQALRHALAAYEALSNAGYTFRALAAEERQRYETVKHLLDVLDVLHAPKVPAP